MMMFSLMMPDLHFDHVLRWKYLVASFRHLRFGAQGDQARQIILREIVRSLHPRRLSLDKNVLVRLQSGVVVEKSSGNFEQSRPPARPLLCRGRIWIRHRRTASAAEGNAIGGRLAQDRRLVGGYQFYPLDQAEIFDAHV